MRKTRTAIDWAEEIKYLLAACYLDSEKIIRIMDNLNTHPDSALHAGWIPLKKSGRN